MNGITAALQEFDRIKKMAHRRDGHLAFLRTLGDAEFAAEIRRVGACGTETESELWHDELWRQAVDSYVALRLQLRRLEA